MKIVLLCLVTGLSAGGGEKKEELRGVVGGSITLPTSLLQRGFLYYNGSVIASVIKGEFDRYVNRVHWNKQTGLFTITDLLRSYSGVYTVGSKEEPVYSSSYLLRVFDPVPTPEVSRLNTNVTTSGDFNQTESGTKEEKRHSYWIFGAVALLLVNVALTVGAIRAVFIVFIRPQQQVKETRVQDPGRPCSDFYPGAASEVD
ncbi:uncharacterized protein ACNS7B_012221 [Menidia menidia]